MQILRTASLGSNFTNCYKKRVQAPCSYNFCSMFLCNCQLCNKSKNDHAYRICKFLHSAVKKFTTADSNISN